MAREKNKPKKSLVLFSDDTKFLASQGTEARILRMLGNDF